MRATIATAGAILGCALCAAAGAQIAFVPVLKPPAASAPAAATTAAPSGTQRVALAGSMGRKALLVIDGGAPRALAVGERWQGVKLLALQDGEAEIELDGQRTLLKLGGTAVNLGGGASPGSGRVIQLSGDASGHFQTPGQINGRSVSFLVDTGATLVSISQVDADRLGLAWRDGPRVGLRTANGTAVGHRISLATVRVGDVDVYNVAAVVQPEPMPFVLLGNSFLNRFQLRRENDTLTLERRY